MQSPDKRHDDGREAVTRRHVRRELADRTGDFECTRQTCGAAGSEQRNPHRTPSREARVPCSGRRKTADLLRKAGPCAKQKHPQRADANQRDDQADADARTLYQARNLRDRFKGFALREVVAAGIFPRSGDHVAEQQHGDIHEHQAHQDFVRVELVAQPRNDGRPEHAAQHAGDEDGRHDPRPRRLVCQQRHAAGGHCAEHELPFGPDVPDVGPKTHCQTERDDEERCRLDHQLADGVTTPDRFVKENEQALHRVFAERRKQHHADQHRDQQREDGRAKTPEARKLRAWFELKHGPSPGRLLRPMCSTTHSSIRRSAAQSLPPDQPTATACPWR